MSAAENKVEKIARHALSAREIVERQRRLIEIQKANGHDTEIVERLLEQFEHVLRLSEQELTEAQKLSS